MKPPEFGPGDNSSESPEPFERESFYKKLPEDRRMHQICREIFPLWKDFINEAGQTIEERRAGRRGKFIKKGFQGVIDCRVTRFNLRATLIVYTSDTTTFETLQLSFISKHQLRIQAGSRQEPSCYVYSRIKTKRAESWRFNGRANLSDILGYARILSFAQDPKNRLRGNEDDQVELDGS